MDIYLQSEGQEKQTILIGGSSQRGKTTLASVYGQDLITQGKYVHLVDLGMKWGMKDKQRLVDAGAEIRLLAQQKVTLSFSTKEELLGCAKCIVSCIGFSSRRATSLLKNILNDLLCKKSQFGLHEIVEKLQNEKAENEWAEEIYDRLENCTDLPDLWFKVDSTKALLTAGSSIIWDLGGLEDFLVQMLIGLILYNLYCAQRRRFKQEEDERRVYVIIDEFQSLALNRESIVGTCLTEGQKYRLFLILITQFLKGRFSDALLGQFKQGGFRFYFRMTEEDAAIVSHQLSADSKIQKILYHRLISLPRGHCLMLGAHTVGKRKEISEAMRFVEVIKDSAIIDEKAGNSKEEQIKKKTISANFSKGSKRVICIFK